MKLFKSFNKFLHILVAVMCPFLSVSADHFDRVHDLAKGKFRAPEPHVRVSSTELTDAQIKGHIVAFLFIQDTYLSYLGQLENNGRHGLDPTSYSNQLQNIEEAIIANAADAVSFLEPIFGTIFAESFALTLFEEASFYSDYLTCNLNNGMSCNAAAIATNWQNTIPPQYTALLNTAPILDPIVLGFALARTVAQQDESGVNGFGIPAPTALPFSNAFNSLQIYMPESIRNGMEMVQTSVLPPVI